MNFNLKKFVNVKDIRKVNLNYCRDHDDDDDICNNISVTSFFDVEIMKSIRESWYVMTSTGSAGRLPDDVNYETEAGHHITSWPHFVTVWQMR
jgi:hypothetical protein